MGFDVRTDKGDTLDLSADDLRDWVEAGDLTPNDLVRPSGTDRWYRADKVDGLFDDGRLSLDQSPANVPKAQPQPRASQSRQAVPPPPPTRQKSRPWLLLVLLVTPFVGVFVPIVPVVVAGLILLPLFFMLFPNPRKTMMRLVRVDPSRPVRGTFKAAFVLLYAVFLLGVGWIGHGSKIARTEYEAKQAALRAEQEEQERQANERVVAMTTEAKQMLEIGNIHEAKAKLAEAVNVPDATSLAESRRLISMIEEAHDEEGIFERLVLFEDSELSELESGDAVPERFAFEFDVLTEKARSLAVGRIDDARQERNRRVAARLEAEERRREAQRAERDRQRELAAAEREREREAAAAKREAEERRKAQAQREIQDKLDAYLAVINTFDPQLVESVSVSQISAESWEAELTMKNIWHLRHKQIRLQDAQTYWQTWALIASPTDPDRARIKLVDLRGNRVGGSGWLAGSLVSVDD